MDQVKFRLGRHAHRDADMIEVYLPGDPPQLVACIYPADATGVRIMSKHMTAENTVVLSNLPKRTDGDEFPVGIVSVTLRKVDP